jgi:hypothetical protein
MVERFNVYLEDGDLIKNEVVVSCFYDDAVKERDALAAKLAEAERLLRTVNSQGHTVMWQRAVKDWLGTPDSAAEVQK